jgi:hypothetical protein
LPLDAGKQKSARATTFFTGAGERKCGKRRVVLPSSEEMLNYF